MTVRSDSGIGRPGSFLVKVDVSSGCWNWQGAGDRYGVITRNGRSRGAHRYFYETLVASIPAGLQIDHLCRNTRCVNPNHMEPVTGRVNTLRGDGPTAQNAVKAYCDAGHAFDTDNTYVRDEGRYCRACRRDAQRRYMQKPEAKRLKNQRRRKTRRFLGEGSDGNDV